MNFCAPENKPQYINIDSNHPPSIKKQLPYMNNKRLSDISSDAEVFNKSKHVYEKSLKKTDTPIIWYSSQIINKKRREHEKEISSSLIPPTISA